MLRRLAAARSEVADVVPMFQTIVDASFTPIGQEAFTRLKDGSVPPVLLGKGEKGVLSAFDAKCRHRAVSVANAYELDGLLFLNIPPSVVKSPRHGPRNTIDLAQKLQFAPSRLVFEITEHERLKNFALLRAIIEGCQSIGSKFALDDCRDLKRDAKVVRYLRPNYVKLDKSLLITLAAGKAELSEFCRIAAGFGVEVIGEGVETQEAFDLYVSCGVSFLQGYHIAYPQCAADLKRRQPLLRASSTQLRSAL